MSALLTDNRTTLERYFVDGHWLEAIKLGAQQPNLPTIVMLHEGLGSIAHWKDFPSQLVNETGAGVFVYSRYGHGTSDCLKEARSRSYMHHEAQVVLPEILRQAGIEHPVFLGHSDGASVAIIYSGSFPDSPRALILEAPHVFVEELSVKSIAHARILYRQTDLARRLARYHANAEPLFWGWNNIWLAPDFRNWNIEYFLDLIRCPVLILQGAQDEYGTARQIAAIEARIPAAAAVILEDCKHAPHRDQPTQTLTAIREFLSTLPGCTNSSSSPGCTPDRSC